ncbi:hypothetical protein A2U01_0015401 [Trifolium medium]|uniref:Reverse transcriptase domain-containing protein n=1 Tax=Trifolium medium TaxID=97028 RepID=A0A392N3Z3_9FABA|nr:hypothetical protein [Trifolium medium]
MPFGLTNAPSTFQSAMNDAFRPFLRRFVTVFFDDILVYSKSTQEHVFHLQQVLQCLEDKEFFAKGSKCQFFQTSVEYLGHLVSSEGVRADPSKVSAMNSWPKPKNLKQLRGFLGLTGYYRRFVANYATIAAPLTELLKKDNFVWSEKANNAFELLKHAMTVTPVLRLPEASIANRPLLHPIAILAGRFCMKQGLPRKQVLVQWSHSQPEDATWEDLSSFVDLYGIPDLEDKVNFEEGSSDSFDQDEVPLDTGPIQQLVKEWADTEPIEEETEQQASTTDKLEPRRRNKPAWTRDFIMAMLK